MGASRARPSKSAPFETVSFRGGKHRSVIEDFFKTRRRETTLNSQAKAFLVQSISMTRQFERLLGEKLAADLPTIVALWRERVRGEGIVDVISHHDDRLAARIAKLQPSLLGVLEYSLEAYMGTPEGIVSWLGRP